MSCHLKIDTDRRAAPLLRAFQIWVPYIQDGLNVIWLLSSKHTIISATPISLPLGYSTCKSIFVLLHFEI